MSVPGTSKLQCTALQAERAWRGLAQRHQPPQLQQLCVGDPEPGVAAVQRQCCQLTGEHAGSTQRAGSDCQYLSLSRMPSRDQGSSGSACAACLAAAPSPGAAALCLVRHEHRLMRALNVLSRSVYSVTGNPPCAAGLCGRLHAAASLGLACCLQQQGPASQVQLDSAA